MMKKTKEMNQSVCSFSGRFAELMKWIETNQLLRRDLWKRFVQQFREDSDADAGWRCEYWGKMMCGGCLVYQYTKDDALYAVLTETIQDMLQTQDVTGRISSYAVNHEFDGWDLWGRKYVLMGMQQYYAICADENLRLNLLDSMCRQMNYIIGKIGPESEGKRPITKATRHWRGLNSASILEPVVRLYQLTHLPCYLEFAAYIAETGGTDVENLAELAAEDKLYPYQYPVTKAYEMISYFCGLLAYAEETDNAALKNSVCRFADKVLESDFTIIGCAGCTHELFDHSTVRQANTDNGAKMQETCVTVLLMKLCSRLTLETGDSRYMDAFERSFYNAYLGAVNTEQVLEPTLQKEYPTWDMEPLPFDSYSPLTSGTRGNGIGGLKRMSDNHYYGCCACIGSVGAGLVPRMALVRTHDGAAVNLYFPGLMQLRTPEENLLVLHSETEYPAAGTVRLTMAINKPEMFTLQLRIPAWSHQTALMVNGKATHAEPGQYCGIRRTWQTGDTVELCLDMRTQVLHPEPYGHQVLMNKVVWGANYIVPTYDREDPAAKNHIALRRGPLILAQDSRLGYSPDTPISLAEHNGDTIDAASAPAEAAPYPCMVNLQIPLEDGKTMPVTDYASAGKLWSAQSRMAAWMLVHPKTAKG